VGTCGPHAPAKGFHPFGTPKSSGDVVGVPLSIMNHPFYDQKKVDEKLQKHAKPSKRNPKHIIKQPTFLKRPIKIFIKTQVKAIHKIKIVSEQNGYHSHYISFQLFMKNKKKSLTGKKKNSYKNQ